MKLDLKDKKLLYEIDFDARKPYSMIAKKLKMSKRGVQYKLENLEKKKTLLGYTPVINLSKLGYFYFRVFIKFQNLTRELRKKIEDYITKSNNIGWAIWYYGVYDIGFTIWAKNVSDFKKTINKFYFSFDKYIKERVESIGTEVVFYKNRYLLMNKSTENFVLEEKKEEIELDDIDKKLLKILVKQPRATIINISNKIEESAKRIAYRLKRLKRENILLGIRPIINHQLLGKTHYKVFMDLNNSSEVMIKQLETYVIGNPRIIYTVKAFGTCDFDVELMVDSNDDFIDFIEDLHAKFPGLVRDYQTMILTKTIKAKFLPF